MNLFKHLHTKILAVAISTLVLAVTLITVANVANFSMSYRSALEDRSITVAENIRSVVYRNIKYFPLDSFTGMATLLRDVLTNNPGLSYCYIADTHGRILYASDENIKKQRKIGLRPVSIFNDKKSRGETLLHDGHYESIIPIIYENDYLGTVHVAIEKKIVNQKILTMVFQNTMILILFLTLAIYILYRLVTQQVTRPVNLLVDRVINITEEPDATEPIAVTGEDELGKLASSFNQMQTSLANYIRELNYRNNALQTINTIADKLYKTFDMETIAKYACDAMAAYSNSPRTALFAVDNKNKTLRCLYSLGFGSETIKNARILPLEGSLSGITVRNKDVTTSYDILKDETIVPEVKQALIGDGLNIVFSIPLLFQDDVLGVLNIFFVARERGPIDKYERDIFISIGKTIGLAMSNSRHVAQIKAEIAVRLTAEKELDYRNNALHTINAIADKLYRSFDMQTIAKEAVESIAGYTNSPRASLFAIDEENKQFRLLYTRGFSSATIEAGSLLPLEGSFSGMVMKTRQIVTSYDIADDQSMVPEVKKALLEEKLSMVIGIPLLFQDKVLGVMNLFFRENERGPMEDYETEIFLSIGKTIGLAMANAQHVAQIEAEIKERKKAEAEIRNLNEELEQRVMERTKELEFANKELESFSYSVSHDLRAPLRSIDGFSKILLEDYESELSHEPVRYLHLLRDNAQQMGNLISDMLSFSRMSRLPLTKQEVDPAEIVRPVLKELEDMQKNRQVEIVIGDMPQCHADPAMLKVVYVNLLSNALKFTSKKEKAFIEIGCNQKDEDVFYVKDNGAGFDMKYVDKIFGVFQRLHLADEFEGTGCGTAIVQRIINRHGGRIWVEARLNEGADFYFTLGEGGL